MKSNKRILLVFFLFGCIAARAQDKIYMPYFQMDGIYWEYQISAAKTFKSYLDSTKKYILILPKYNNESYPNETFFQTITNAKTSDARYFILGYMKAKSDAMVISMVLFSMLDSSVVWNDYLIARTSYDLDTILKLFAENIGSEHFPSKENNNYSLTYFYPKELIKPDASFNFGLSLSLGYSPVDRANRIASTGFGFLFSYDSKHVIFDLQGDYLPGDYHRCIFQLASIRISGIYPISKTKNTPYIGGSIAYSAVRYTYPNPHPKSYFTEERADGMGLALYANAGYLFLRNSKYQFRLSGSFFYPFYHTEVWLYPETRIPLGFIVNAIVLGHK